MKNKIVKVKSINAGFGDNEVIRNISFNVEENEVVALIGPSGCGKSTFIRCINRLHEETKGAWVRGEILVEDENIYGLTVNPVDIRSTVGMVFQKPNPFPNMSVFDNVAAGLKLKGNHRKKDLEIVVEKSLRQAALWEEVKDKLNSPGTSLSGGQQQRLCIARALAIKPKVLLMDEPTSALDPISTGKVEELIRYLQKEITILIVTHNMQQATRISQKTGFFFLGDLVEFGSTEQIFKQPKNKRTEDYVMGKFG
jgi:phosphate transport system ATP-binding protein